MYGSQIRSLSKEGSCVQIVDLYPDVDLHMPAPKANYLDPSKKYKGTCSVGIPDVYLSCQDQPLYIDSCNYWTSLDIFQTGFTSSDANSFLEVTLDKSESCYR